MSWTALLGELQRARVLVTGLVEDRDEADWRSQAHPDLSPLGWHLGHCTFTECYWLQEVIQHDARYTTPVADLYTPPRTPKSERGKQLPPREALLAWVHGLQEINTDTLENPSSEISGHPLMQDHYLLHFLVQHYSQHFETMLMILVQQALASDDGNFHVSSPLEPVTGTPQTCRIDGGHYRVGGQAPGAYDNELPVQQATLGAFDIAVQPVTNGEFLAFMEDDGYDNPALWSPAGRGWREQAGVRAPDHWRCNAHGHWYGIGSRGPYELAGNDVLHGICRHEAQAYARWANARLPHEHQWEVACRLHRLEQTGRAWEWCDNSFYPYDGFRSFPYEEYSTPWFDDNHFTLRGGSLHTRPAIRRPAFRNFYEPEKRHVFAGLRLVY
ncbi:MAG: SUMF1/EgtB/PvdO family nonheme iron enzyme [Gammaproteobacteria bacterium]|nr:MAG: SUMF1/EgtB/PvdO family nonheme iron enzyme [Gammaproteobacteria bacterium]